MLKDLAGSFTLSSRTHVEVRSISGVRIEKLLSSTAHALADVHVVALHVGTNNVREEPLVLIARFRSLISRILDVNPSIRVVVSAFLPRQASLRKCQWALSVGELEAFSTDAGETNSILQVLCHKNGYGFVDGTHELMGMLKADGVHVTKRGSQHKVKKTGRTAVRLCSSAFEQSPPSDCGSPDACGITSTSPPSDCGPPDACSVTSTVSPQQKVWFCARAAVRLTTVIPHLVVKTLNRSRKQHQQNCHTAIFAQVMEIFL
ncbi:hypothetical protein HPB51_020500 [Rhipicephalus microplus]|uniref:Uncharacterized protein n=1 Tax=Rhipicephalus microplus TaxID=6941 RepID=A0A9J6E3T9_RHIMP|nr:hypothetical protein HPB51_020500 [Rhipicephalus microplus]